jgi:hypothetical protein
MRRARAAVRHSPVCDTRAAFARLYNESDTPAPDVTPCAPPHVLAAPGPGSRPGDVRARGTGPAWATSAGPPGVPHPCGAAGAPRPPGAPARPGAAAAALRCAAHALGCGSPLAPGLRRASPGDWLSGRAPRSHRGGHWFDPSIAHQVLAGQRPDSALSVLDIPFGARFREPLGAASPSASSGS